MNIKALYHRYKPKWRICVLGLILVLIASLAIWRLKRHVELYSEGWIQDYVKERLKLDVVWDGWEWDLLFSSVNISGLRLREGETGGTNIWIYTEQIELYYNPFLLLKEKLIDIKSINLKGLKCRLRLAGPDYFDQLKGFVQVRPEKEISGKGGWSFRLEQIVADGQDLAIDLPEQKGYISLKDFMVLVQKLDSKGPYPIQIGFNEADMKWRGLYRIMDSGKIKGSFDYKGIHIDDANIKIPEEGRLSWAGDIEKRAGRVYVEGRYSAVLFCDTIASFMKPFSQMKGKVSSKGRVIGPWGKMRIEADVAAEEFFWRQYNFNAVKGQLAYHAGVLDFKDFEGIWRDGHLEAESQIRLRDRDALIKIHAQKLPSDSLSKIWADIFPNPPIEWRANMQWRIIWPEKIPKSQIELKMSAPLPIPGQSPPRSLGIYTRFNSEKGLIHFDLLEINFADNRIRAEGDYDIQKKELGLAYECDIREKDVILVIWGLPLLGRGRIQGRMDGLISGPKFTGQVKAENIGFKGYYLDHLFMDYRFQKDRLDIDHLKGALQDAELAGGGCIRFPISLNRPEVEFFWSAQGLPLPEILKHVPYKPGFPYKGQISAEGDLRIMGGKMESKGSVFGQDIAFLGQQGLEIKAQFDASERRISFYDITLKRGEAAVEGGLSFEREKGWSFHADASSWRISHIHLDGGRVIPVEGLVDFHITGGLEAMSGRFKAREITYNDLGPWDISGTIGLRDDYLHTSLRYPWGEAQAGVNLQDEVPFTISASCQNFPVLDAETGFVEDPNRSHSVILDGYLELSGLLKKGVNSLTGRFEGSKLKVHTPFARFESLEPYEIILKDEEFSVSSLYMQGDKVNIEVGGRWHLQKGFDINAVGLIPLGTFQNQVSFLKGLSGQTEMSLNLKGTKTAPSFQGNIQISEGGFLVPQYNLRLDHIQGRIELSNGSAFIEGLSGQTRGGGWFEMSGTLGYKGLEFNAFDLMAGFENVYIYKRNAYRAYLEGDLEWTGSPDSSLLEGHILIKQARHTGYENIIQLLMTKKREVEATQEKLLAVNARKWINNTRLAIELDLGDDFWVKSPFYNAAISGDLLIKGMLSAPWLYGDVEVVEGDVNIGAQVFELTSGRIKLPDPELSEPTVNAVALKDVNGQRLRLSVFGPLREPKLQFSSIPYMSQPEILNMVFFGLSTENGGAQHKESDIFSLMLSTTSRVLDDVFGEKVSYYTGLDMLRPGFLPKDLFSVDILDLELKEKGAGVERLTLGKTLSRRLKLKYSRLTGEEDREIAEAEYTVTDHLTLIGAQDDQGTYSFDLNFGFRF